MVEGRTARRSHSRKKGQMASSLRSTPKASGLTARARSSCRKWREALLGGSSWTTCHPRRGAWAASAARKTWTAAVCSMFGQVAPPEWGVGVLRGDAPPSPGQDDGGAVPAGQERQPPVGEGQPSAPVAVAGCEAEAFEGYDDLGRPLGNPPSQAGR